jgi:hypothetical protein
MPAAIGLIWQKAAPTAVRVPQAAVCGDIASQTQLAAQTYARQTHTAGAKRSPARRGPRQREPKAKKAGGGALKLNECKN